LLEGVLFLLFLQSCLLLGKLLLPLVGLLLQLQLLLRDVEVAKVSCPRTLQASPNRSNPIPIAIPTT
jgi:hypothetical protein